MISDVCTWIYEYASSWLPSWPTFEPVVDAGSAPARVSPTSSASESVDVAGRDPRATASPLGVVAGFADELAGGEPQVGEGTTDALARARDALAALDRGPGAAPARPLRDARFRSPLAGAAPAATVVDRLVLGLNEIDGTGLVADEREALLEAASGLLARLQQ